MFKKPMYSSAHENINKKPIVKNIFFQLNKNIKGRYIIGRNYFTLHFELW